MCILTFLVVDYVRAQAYRGDVPPLYGGPPSWFTDPDFLVKMKQTLGMALNFVTGEYVGWCGMKCDYV